MAAESLPDSDSGLGPKTDPDPRRLLLIVTGSTLRAEELDRPLAYYLKQRIEQIATPVPLRKDRSSKSRAASASAPASSASTKQVRFRGLVVADFRWIHEKSLQALPTISLGGPGVNALARQWLEELTVSLAVDEQYYIQMDPDLKPPHASVWGMDNANTQIAVSVFLDRFLPRFLAHHASHPPIRNDRDDDPALDLDA